MKKRSIKDVAASVHRRLLNVARQTNRPFNDLLQYYADERWLYRLSQSQYSDRFILKGALMLLVWDTPVMRPTRDIDLLGRVSNDLESIRSAIAEVCQAPVEDDGLIFDADNVTTERITEDADYEGVRARFRGHLGNSRIAMQIDIGFGDEITPGPVGIVYPTILDHPSAELRAYNRETAVAEKLEAMVKLGELNSRMKDFFDIWLLAENFEFNGQTLAESVRRTFERRQTQLDSEPICLTDSFSRNSVKADQWDAFVRRGRLSNAATGFPEVIEHVRAFLKPLMSAIAEEQVVDMRWPPGGPWQPQS
ncbi:MAG: nucleotidyl transferase AbiEii/AbiGii toxin family protein [Phycisphaerae bacterium]|nr:nucleotidyl transferase AbiEii/AbiGii toxin family protein [Phycisphaerae bacterium]